MNGLVTFYSDLCGWEPVDDVQPGFFQVAKVADDENPGSPGAIWNGGPAGGESYAIFYAEVDDLDAALVKASNVGGKVLVAATSAGPVRWGHIQDPAGNRFGVFQRIAA